MRHKDPELMKKIHDFAYPPNNIPFINKLSPSCGSGITDSYVFTNPSIRKTHHKKHQRNQKYNSEAEAS